MNYSSLGQSDIRVSRVCLGTMTFGRQTPESDAHAQMDYALSKGVNFFDTAEMYAVPPNKDTYGKTETIIGNWLSQRGTRRDIVLASKIAGEGVPWIRDGKAISPDTIREALEGSLKRLQTDYLDLYQLHWPNRGSYHFGRHWEYSGGKGETSAVLEDLHQTLETLDEYVRQGVIRTVGLSNETAWGLMQYLKLSEKHGLPRIVSMQNEYSLLNRLYEPELAEVSMRENVGLLAWSPLAGGLLTGKYRGGSRPDGARWTLVGNNHRDTPRAHEAVDAYHKIARQAGLDPVHMALSWTDSRPFVCSTIIGARTIDQLQNDMQAFEKPLSGHVQSQITSVYRQFGPAVY